MILKSFIFLLSLTAPLCAVAQGSKAHPEAGKVYLIHRFNNANAYLYESEGLLYGAPASNTQKQYWRFIPTGETDRYYVQNVTTGRYLQSTAKRENRQVTTGTAPIAYEVKANSSSTAARGYYYLCSADQPIDAGKDGTLGINFQESTGKVVAYHIRYNRANSYWDLSESPYDYVAPEPRRRTALARRLGLYDQPCGSPGTAWLQELRMTGEGVSHPLHYSAAEAPADYWMPVRRDSLCLSRGTSFRLTYTAAGIDGYHAVTAWFDWNGDGIFEASQAFGSQTEGEADVHVPDTARMGKVRLRLRLTDNGTEGADDEVHGTVYDFMVYITAGPSSPTAISPVLRPLNANARAYGLDGRPVSLPEHKGIYIHEGHKRIK